MKNKSAAFIAEAVFKKETKIIHNGIKALHTKMDISLERLDEKIDSSVERLDKKIDSSVERLALAIVQTKEELMGKMDKNMEMLASKHDLLFSQMTDLSKHTHIVLQNQQVHRAYIHDHEERLIALEKRP